MKTKLKNMWIVVAPDGYPHTSTLDYLKKDSIASFMRNAGNSEWIDWKSAGWICKKVNVEFTPL